MKIVCISDTHNRLKQLHTPDGDVLVHAGDLTGLGRFDEVARELNALSQLSKRYKHTVLIAGNHDWLAEKNPEMFREMCKERGLIYLQDESITIDGVKFYGTPWSPWFRSWAFNLYTSEELTEKWNKIPNDTDVLITHCPPRGKLDKLGIYGSDPGAHVGCEELRKAVLRVRPKLHVFGHIHEAAGQEEEDGIQYINASNCDEGYALRNPAKVIQIL